jgi:hypothetical protein
MNVLGIILVIYLAYCQYLFHFVHLLVYTIITLKKIVLLWYPTKEYSIDKGQ